jgi:hypothetical protein
LELKRLTKAVNNAAELEEGYRKREASIVSEEEDNKRIDKFTAYQRGKEADAS